MTPADEIARLRATVDRKDEQMAALQDEIDRLRRELAACIEAARENGKERDELARQLGAEVARSEMYRKASDAHFASLMSVCDERDRYEKALRSIVDVPLQYTTTFVVAGEMRNIARAALASGNGDGDGAK